MKHPKPPEQLHSSSSIIIPQNYVLRTYQFQSSQRHKRPSRSSGKNLNSTLSRTGGTTRGKGPKHERETIINFNFFCPDWRVVWALQNRNKGSCLPLPFNPVTQ